MNNNKSTSFRWIICAMLFAATTVNYLDRQVLSLTSKDFIAPEFHWNDSHYGVITGYFSLIYAVCMLFAGRIVDWLGTMKGYLWAIFIWSAAACAHAACGWATMHIEGIESIAAMKTIEAGSALAVAVGSTSMWLFLACRCFLGLGEAGNFPAAIRVTSEYFPKKDRAFATSIFNSGSSVGALAAPALIPPMAKLWGWESAFVVIGALGFIWMGFWVFFYRKPESSPYVNAAELAYINSDEADGAAVAKDDGKGVSIWKCFTIKHTWALLLGRFTTDGVWWFFLFWTPSYLSDQFGYTSSSGMGMTLIITLYAIVTFLSIYLCKIPTWFVDKKGMNPYEGRMIAMFIFACLPLLALGAQPLGAMSAWWPAILIGIACAGHQAWSANVYSVVGDMFPKSTIGTLTGIAGLASGCGSFLVNIGAGKLFTWSAAQGEAFAFLGYTGKPAGYMVMFCYCAFAYLIGWTCMKVLVPKYKPVVID